jgi:carboxyl-terminal processing protease
VKQLRIVFLSVSVVMAIALVAFASGASEAVGRGLYRLVGMFGQTVALIRANYVEDVPIDRIEAGAMTGLVEAGDPGGSWVPEESASVFEAVRTRPLPPFGLVLGRRSSYPFVLQVLPGSPAEAAGIVPGELIERVGDVPVRAKQVWQAVALLDAAERSGVEVALDVIDRELEGKRPVKLRAATVPEPAPTLGDRDGVPVVRIPRIDRRSGEQVAALLAPFAGVPGVIVDLRGSALGDADAAPALAAVLAGGTVELRWLRRGGAVEPATASAPARGWRVVVCADASTAGAAEALLVALKGAGATVVGGESFGDTGRRVAVKSTGGSPWLAERWCAGPDGNPVLGDGVKPDERVRERRGADAVLERALEIARGAVLAKAA